MAVAVLVALLQLAGAVPPLRGMADADTCPICKTPGTIGNFTEQTLTAMVEPVGNEPLTGTSFSVQGTTTHDDLREYLVTLGLVSNRGNNSRPTPYHDKVTLYTGITAQSGTGDVWSINPLLTQEPNSGSYNAQGIELDFNNFNAHRGDADAGPGLAPPVSYGLSVTTASHYRSTAAISVMGEAKTWNRGIVFANDAIAQSTFQDLTNPQKSVDIRGNPGYGVYQSSPASKNLFAGKTGIGLQTDEIPAATLDVGGDIHFTGALHHKDAKGGRHRPVVLGSSAAVNQRLLSGNAVLNESGGAEVILDMAEVVELGGRVDDYEVTYTLTAIGAPMPTLHVATELQLQPSLHDDRAVLSFGVAGGVAGKRVSWQLGLAMKQTSGSGPVFS